jgi:hypothetical protein
LNNKKEEFTVKDIPKWGTPNRKLCLNGDHLELSDMSKGIEIKLDKNMAYTIIKELKKRFKIEKVPQSQKEAILPFTLHCPVCGQELPKDSEEYIRNEFGDTFECNCGATIYLYLDDYVDYKQKYIDIGLNWADTERGL